MLRAQLSYKRLTHRLALSSMLFKEEPIRRVPVEQPVALMPYPLVKRFLEDQIAASAGTLQLVVVDAKSAHESVLLASTYHSILAALTMCEGTVQTTHRLVLDEATDQYRVDIVA